MSDLWTNGWDDNQEEVEEVVPFFTIDRESSKTLHDWLKDTYLNLFKESEGRIRLQQAFLLAYKGFYDPYFIERSDSMRQTEALGTGRAANQKPKRLPVNHLRDLVEQSVSRITSLPIAIEPFPGTNEVMDKNGSVIVKSVLETIRYQNNMKAKYRKCVRRALVLGEGYVMPWWNPNRGPLDKEYVKLAEKGERIPKTKDGKTIHSESGEPVYIEAPIHIGDVGFDTPYPWDIFLLNDYFSDEVVGFFRRRYVHVDEVRAMHPEVEGINNTPDVSYYNFHTLEFKRVRNYCLYIEFYHRRTQFLPNGYYAAFTWDKICKQGDSPYPWQLDSEFGDLPLERLTGFDIDGGVYGEPNVSDIAALQHALNQLTTMVRRNIWHTLAMKWVAPKGSVNVNALINTPGVLEFTGPIPPQLVTFSTVPAEVFAFRNDIKSEMEQLSGIYGVSRGDPPPNTRTAEQLAFYEEQQQQRASGPLGKYSEFVLAIDRKTLAIVADNYEQDDGRLRLILGEDQEPMLQPYNVKLLSQPWNIRLKAASSLSTSTSVRMKQLLEIRREYPELLTAEQFADLTQFGQVDKVYTVARAAISMAEAENQLIAEGQKVDPPQAYQEHIVHWRTHIKYMNTYAFQQWPEKKKETLFDHVMGHEYEMHRLMQKNPAFAQKLMTLEGFPAFFVQKESPPAPMPVVPPPPMEGAPPGAPLPEIQEENLQLPALEESQGQIQ